MDIKIIEGEPIPQIVLLKEALKAWVAAYKEAIEKAVKVTAEAVVNVAVNAVAEIPLGELGGLSKPVIIKPDNDETESHDEGTYAAFKKVIEVENYKAFYIKTL